MQLTTPSQFTSGGHMFKTYLWYVLQPPLLPLCNLMWCMWHMSFVKAKCWLEVLTRTKTTLLPIASRIPRPPFGAHPTHSPSVGPLRVGANAIKPSIPSPLCSTLQLFYCSKARLVWPCHKLWQLSTFGLFVSEQFRSLMCAHSLNQIPLNVLNKPWVITGFACQVLLPVPVPILPSLYGYHVHQTKLCQSSHHPFLCSFWL